MGILTYTFRNKLPCQEYCSWKKGQSSVTMVLNWHCGIFYFNLATVDGSEIRRENHLGCKKQKMVLKQPSPQRIFTQDFWTINTYTGDIQKSRSSIASFWFLVGTSASQISTWHLLWYVGRIHRVGFPCLEGPPAVPERPTVQRYDVDWNRPQRPLPWRSLKQDHCHCFWG